MSETRDCGLREDGVSRTIRALWWPAARGAKPEMTTRKFSTWRTTALRFALSVPFFPACADKPAATAEVHASATDSVAPPPTAPSSAAPAPPKNDPPSPSPSPEGAAPSRSRALHVEEDLAVRLRREVDGAAQADPADSKRVSPVHPVLKCVERSSKGEWRAHFGYRNTGRESLPVAVGLHNRVWPPPIGQGQPTTFQPGNQADALQLPFVETGEVAWVLGQSFDVAKAGSRHCPGTSDKRTSNGAQDASLIPKISF